MATTTQPAQINWTAGGTIAPFRFVKALAGSVRSAIQCTVQGEDAVGVSGSSMALPSGTPGADNAVHASTDYPNALRVKGNDNDIVEVEVGTSTITVGSKVMTDSSGKAVSFSGSTTFSGSSFSLGTLLGPGTSVTPGVIAQVSFHRQRDYV